MGRENWRGEYWWAKLLAQRVTLALSTSSAASTSSSAVGKKKTSDDTSTVIGRVVVGVDQVMLETNSKQRRVLLKPRITKALGSTARHIHGEEKPFDAFADYDLYDDSDDRDDDMPEIPAELMRQVLGEQLKAHYATWPDIALPALAGA